MNKRKYFIFTGSKEYFLSHLPKFASSECTKSFLDIVKESDEYKTKGFNFDDKADNLILSNDNYNGITEQAHDRIGALIEEVTKDDSKIYIHNPPITLKHYLEGLQLNPEVSIEYSSQTYEFDRDEESFQANMRSIEENIIGQSNAIIEVSKSMWYLTKVKRKKPYVIMLYGSSSLGKTELVREISTHFYKGKFFEKHLSMFKNNTYSDYFFGDKPNRKTLGYDLLERKSNLIFLDELDKCSEHFYSAFYTLFDNTLFKDASYEVDVSDTLIILTSNYHDEKDMINNLGLPIYYRIDKFIPFTEFNSDIIYRLTKKEIRDKKEEYNAYLTEEEIYCKVSTRINSKGENARTIKQKVQQSIEELLFDKMIH
ncbi:AAA family ATPase [Lactococcus formosensis]|uniref:AAA family ATPase n=1 Tax=Lactococcus formosensis TaxID=1281486 RepID=UPI002435585E|nr:AAA family ATPase [Lactococcus formosensis]MDG6188450.1 AAA family ATPase [Lactococcus formosensis]